MTLDVGQAVQADDLCRDIGVEVDADHFVVQLGQGRKKNAVATAEVEHPPAGDVSGKGEHPLVAAPEELAHQPVAVV